MTNEYKKMSNEELVQAVGGRHGKKGLCEGLSEPSTDCSPAGLHSAPSPAMTTATRSASFTIEMLSRSSAMMLWQSMTSTRPNTQAIHGFTPRGST